MSAGNKLFDLAIQQEWDSMITHLASTASQSLLLQATDPSQPETGGTLLHAVCTYPSATLQLVQAILQVGGPHQMATMQNNMQQSPLHLVILCIPKRSDLVELLVEAAPEMVQHRDFEYMRPIDILCRSIIMKEERAKYNNTHNDKGQETLVEKLWECARILAHASSCALPRHHHEHHRHEHQPMVHACLQANNFPFALTERAIRRYPQQLQQADSDGDLPLHIASRIRPDEDDDNLFEEIVNLYPKAASMWNKERKIPLDVAIESGGRRWNSGISCLLEAHPVGIESRGLASKLYPMIFAQLSRLQRTNLLYRIIQAKPELFHRTDYTI
jgi:ankyrin repeat protein